MKWRNYKSIDICFLAASPSTFLTRRLHFAQQFMSEGRTQEPVNHELPPGLGGYGMVRH